MEGIFFEISIILIVATGLAAVAKILRQPTIPAYILAGVLLGPPILNIVRPGEVTHTLSTFGIAFLLFLVGIQLDLRKFVKVGHIAVLLGLAQMAFAVTVGYVLAVVLGFKSIEAIFLALALAFSSTIIVVKLLGERRELDTLHGQLTIGILLTQDLLAIFFLMSFSLWGGAETLTSLLDTIFFTILRGVILFSTALIASRFLLARLFKFFAFSQELLFLGAISWCFILAILALKFHFSLEIGALIAGLSLSFLPYSVEIGHRVRSLRDFFLPIFFAILGAQLIFERQGNLVLPIVILSIFVLFGSSAIVALCLLWRGFRAQTSFFTALALGQVSEFSFILVSLGQRDGLFGREIVGIVALIGLITMTISSYLIEYQDHLFQWCNKWIKKFERKDLVKKLHFVPRAMHNHTVIIGFHTMGYKIFRIFEERDVNSIVVDYNPLVIEHLQNKKIAHIFGNMSDTDVLNLCQIRKAKYIISTVPSRHGTLALLHYFNLHHTKAKIIVTAFDISEAIDYYKRKADFVLFPVSLSADYVRSILNDNFKTRKVAHLKELEMLNKLEHTHFRG